MRLATIALLSVVLSAPLRAEFELNNGVAAIANSSVITVQDVRQASADIVDTYRRTYRNNPEVFDQKRVSALTDKLEQLIDWQLVLHDFKNLGGTIQESYIDDLIKERIREQFGDRVTLTKTLQAQGITYETFRQRERERVINMIMERKNVREAVLISPAKIERFYQTNLHRFKLGDRVKLRMIVLNRPPAASADGVCRLATDIRNKITDGAAFAEMASVYSEGPDKKNGGLFGWKEERELNKGLGEVAFALKQGECSSVLGLARAGDDSYWIYKYDKAGKLVSGRKYTGREEFVEEKTFENQAGPNGLELEPQLFYLLQADEREAAKTRSLEEVRDEIEKDLLLQERARLQKNWINRLRNKSFVRYF
jgi:parvulin-like peptidyl-prolyl isomerase